MYAFKVVTTTLMILLIISLVFSGLRTNGTTKVTIIGMMVVIGMGIVSIWG